MKHENKEPLTLEQLREMLESSEIVGAAVTVLDHGVCVLPRCFKGGHDIEISKRAPAAVRRP